MHTAPHELPAMHELRRLFRGMMAGPRGKPGLIPRQFRGDRVIFIHVPKCAGSAFLDAYLGFQTGHVTARDYHAADPDFFASAYVFTFVRNPLARFVSAYNHIHTDDLWACLPEVRPLVDRHGATVSEVAASLQPDSELLRLPWFAPQHTFLELRGRLAVNRAFKTESFAADLEVLTADVPIRLRPLAEVNRRDPGQTAPDAALSAEAVANLRRIYSRDFTLFGYY
ncbi:MAG: sulfotransferase family protein [Planctomycetia bacterium]|nr:sulfotransferase family protein [Planctomycetia bacterium]